MSLQDQKYEQMTASPLRLLILKLALPSIAIMLVTSVYNMADTYFVGSLGTSETAAVGAAFPLMSIIQAFGYFFGHGAGNYISRTLGRREEGRAAEMSATAFYTLFGSASILALLGLLNLTGLAKLLGASETMLPYTKDYIAFILIAMPFMSAALMLNNLLRFQGSALYAMIGMVGGAVLNIFLDPIFIYTLKMGVKGAAAATMASQMASFFLMLYATSLGGNLRVKLKNYRLSLNNLKQIFLGGFPSLSRQSVIALAMLVTNNFAVSYGDGAVAGISIALRVTALASNIMIGIGQGFQPVCGFNYGAKKFSRVKEGFWFSTIASFAFLTIFAVMSFIFAPELILLFRKGDPQVVKVGADALKYSAIALPLSSFSIILSMMLQTIGMSGKASVMAAARQGIFLLPLLFIFAPIYGLNGIIASMPASDILASALGVPFYISAVKAFKLDEGPDINTPIQPGG